MTLQFQNWFNKLPQLRSKFRIIRTLQFTFTTQITLVIVLLFSIGNVVIFRTTSERLIRNTYLSKRDQLTGLIGNINQWKESTGLLMDSLSQQLGIQNLDNTKIDTILGPITRLTPDRVWRVFDRKGDWSTQALSQNVDHIKKAAGT